MKNAKKGGKRSAFRPKSRKPKGGLSKAVKTYIKKTLHSNIENKQFVDYAVNAPITSVSGTTPTNVSLVPAIAQGVTDITRIGNELKCVKGLIRGYVNFLPYNIATNPMSAPLWIKMFLVSYKTRSGVALGSTTVNSDFFEVGGATSGFNGNMRDLLTPVNSESWTLYQTKTCKLGFSSTSASAPAGTVGFYDNSPFSIPFSFNYGKHLKTKLLYNDASTSCTNRNMYLLFQAVYADGTNTAILPAELHYCNEFKYEDA